MRRRNDTKAFSIMEIMLVLIIIGILVGMAMPKMFSMVERARAKEAFEAVSIIEESIKRCWQLTDYDYAACHANVPNFTNLDIDDPGNAPGAHFTYGRQGINGAPASNMQMMFRVEAYRNTRNGGSGDPNDKIVFEYRLATGLTYEGKGIYTGLSSN